MSRSGEKAARRLCDLEAKRRELRVELDTVARESRKPALADAHQRVDEVLSAVWDQLDARFDALAEEAARGTLAPDPLEAFAATWAGTTDPKFVKRLHAAVDELAAQHAGRFREETRERLQARHAELQEQLEAVEATIAERRAQLERDALERLEEVAEIDPDYRRRSHSLAELRERLTRPR